MKIKAIVLNYMYGISTGEINEKFSFSTVKNLLSKLDIPFEQNDDNKKFLKDLANEFNANKENIKALLKKYDKYFKDEDEIQVSESEEELIIDIEPETKLEKVKKPTIEAPSGSESSIPNRKDDITLEEVRELIDGVRNFDKNTLDMVFVLIRIHSLRTTDTQMFQVPYKGEKINKSSFDENVCDVKFDIRDFPPTLRKILLQFVRVHKSSNLENNRLEEDDIPELVIED